MLALLCATLVAAGPVVTSEVAFDVPVSGPASEAQYEPAAASDGMNRLVVWSDARGLDGDNDVWGALVGPDGTVRTPGVRIATGPDDERTPAIAFGQGRYLVVWHNASRGGVDTGGRDDANADDAQRRDEDVDPGEAGIGVHQPDPSDDPQPGQIDPRSDRHVDAEQDGDSQYLPRPHVENLSRLGGNEDRGSRRRGVEQNGAGAGDLEADEKRERRQDQEAERQAGHDTILV